jgi:hypothetical protein
LFCSEAGLRRVYSSKQTKINPKINDSSSIKENPMTQSNEPNDRNQDIDRHLRGLSRRVDRLEYSQISPQEFSRSFDRVYDEIDALENIVNERFDQVSSEIRELRLEIGTLNQKFDVVMQYITGQGGAN